MRVQYGRLRSCGLWAIIVVLGISASASAATLQLGEALFNPATTGSPLTIGGYSTTTYSELLATSDLRSSGDLVCRIISEVYRDSKSGQLAFVYRFLNESTKVDLEHATLGGTEFASWLNLVVGAGMDSSDTSRGGAGKSTAFATTQPTWEDGDLYMLSLLPSGALTMDWGMGSYTGTMIQPGGRSALIWVLTEATDFALVDVAVQDGGRNGIGRALAPVSVPEPATWGLLGLGIGMVGLIRRRRRP